MAIEKQRHYTAVDRPPRTPLVCTDKSLTRQSEAKACDINNIMKRYEKTGVLPVVDRQAFYADVSTIGDYVSVIEHIKMGEEFFQNSLPAELRAEFENDAAKFLDFVSDPSNRDRMRELGLLEAEDPAPVAPEAPPEAPEGA